jgi:hypothetical protein
MAIAIKPDDLLIQRRAESVIYELAWDVWDEELAKLQRDALVSVETVRGLPCALERLADDRARRVARILVRSPEAHGLYRVTRTVTTKGTPPERRRRQFSVLVE